MKLDLSKTGLEMIHPYWQVEALRVVWEAEKGLISRDVWERVNSRLTPKVSRASIINFLNYMHELGVFSGTLESGKGGYRLRYSVKLDEKGYKEFLVEKILKQFKENFPSEFEQVIRS